MDNNQFSFHTSFPKLRKWNEVFWPPIFRFLIPQITLISVSKISCENSPLQRTQHPCFSVPSPPGGSWMMGLTLMFHNLPDLQTSLKLLLPDLLSPLSFPADRICFRAEMCTVEPHVLGLAQIYTVIPRAVPSVQQWWFSVLATPPHFASSSNLRLILLCWWSEGRLRKGKVQPDHHGTSPWQIPFQHFLPSATFP